MADARDTTSCSYRCRYHVFVSFRGEDTRKGFTDHLYRALELAGIHTFIDGEEIKRGENIADELQKAIQESHIAIIVFSNEYASSRWCLDELAKIMKRKRTDGYIVVPVFYKVDPSTVRLQTGSFAEAFAKHEKRFAEEMHKVDEWRKSLKDVADLGGMVLGDQYESHLINNIIDEIGKKLDPITLNVAPFAVGIDARVDDLNSWLRDVSDDVGVAGIWGMGGIGKTTIAKVAYNMNLDRFEGSSFLADIRATSEQPNGVVHLQRKLISDIQKGKTRKIYNVEEGMSKIKHIVCCKRVLVVLDDVNDLDQLSGILGMREWFHPGSRIIITTRQKHLLKASRVSKMFVIQQLDEHESLELFSWHAFRQAEPIKSHMELSTLVVQHCEGLPLALQVLGSSLFGNSVDDWQSALEKLAVIPDGKIQKVLRLSYDYLEDDHEKSLFLHVASFFIGKEISFTVTVLDNLGFFTRIGVQSLVDRCLLQIKDDKLVMHQLIRDMGKGIIREESPDPGKRSKVVHRDAYNIMQSLSGRETINGLLLNLSVPMEGIPSNAILRSCKRGRQVEESVGNCSRRRRLSFFSWKSVNDSSKELASISSEVDFKTEAFRRMVHLQLLILSDVKLTGGYRDFPKKLIWLSWQGFPMRSVPSDFGLGNLVALELQHSSLQSLWRGSKFLPRLKILDLSHSHDLVRAPEFSGLPNLERLILRDCINIIEVHESIGVLQKLALLNLEDCKNLKKLPRSISLLSSLQELIASGCSNLCGASDSKRLGLHSNKPWRSICSWLSPRKSLGAMGNFSLANLPQSLGSLNLVGCNLPGISDDFLILSSLKHLDISGNPILSLPENMKSLIKLESFYLRDCKKLKMLPELPPNLSRLQAERCTWLKKVTNLPNVFKSLMPFFIGCKELTEFQSVFTIMPLRAVDIEMIKNMDLYKLEYSESIEVEMDNFSTETTKKGPLQGVYECGIFSIFLEGSTIPDWYNIRSAGNSVLSVIVPSHPKLKIRGFNVCVVYGLGEYKKYTHSQYLKVSNETKGLMWTYCPISMGVPRKDGLMLWPSHWLFENHELESGDEVRVTVHVGSFLEFPDGQDVLPTKEFGIQLVYEQANKDDQSNSEDFTVQQHEVPYWSYYDDDAVIVNRSFSASEYQMWLGKYFLCHHFHHAHQIHSRRCQENPAHLDFSYEPKDSGMSEYYHNLFKHAIFPHQKLEYL